MSPAFGSSFISLQESPAALCLGYLGARAWPFEVLFRRCCDDSFPTASMRALMELYVGIRTVMRPKTQTASHFSGRYRCPESPAQLKLSRRFCEIHYVRPQCNQSLLHGTLHMSWDVSLYRFSRQYSSLSEIPDDEQAHPLGTLQEVQAAVSAVFPATDWTDPVWGIFDADVGSIEFNVGRDDPVGSLALHVRADEAVIGGILQLCSRLSCQAIDLTDSKFPDQSEHPDAGLQAWRDYRDHVVGNPEV